MTELLRSIFQQLLQSPNDISAMGAECLRKRIVEYLQSKTYLIILDDVWSREDWEAIISVFPDGGCSSRLMATTRNIEVARAMGDGRRVCELNPLKASEAWNLFIKKAFRNEPCPPNLEASARRMVEKCEGLPLAIIAIGGLLSTTDKNPSEWDRVFKSFNWQLSNNPAFQSFNNILLLSFYHLPYYLKRCFLYCCMFPEDYTIKRKRLIRLWVAEGFVKERGELTMEEVAEEYLRELIHRNMLQAAQINRFGKVKAYRIHDMMREVGISLYRDEDFSLPCNSYARDAEQISRCRCISICDDSREILQYSAGMSSSSLRSVIVFNNKNTPFYKSLDKMTSSFRFLRVLDLQALQES